jgi:serine/threonine protein kinase
MHAPDDRSRKIHRYTMYGPIASGGMATVHLGRLSGPAGFSRTVAIKCPHPHYAKDPTFAAMFLDEARLAGRINHPNVVPMLDVVMTDEDLFLVMDYVHGVSLSQALRAVEARGERPAPGVASSIVGDMLRGLHAAHEAKGETGEPLNIVHRDVSPHNVIVGIDGVARLLDFGVAKAVGRLQTTRDGKVKGKLSYMAPEQISGKRLSRRADVYSASVVLWEALTGRRLFGEAREAREGHEPREGRISEVVGKVLFERVPAPSEVVPELPPEIDRLVMRGLEREPAKRYATALEMAEELHRCLPPAAPGEVGAWVRSIGAKEIDEALARISNIERYEAETVAIPAPVATPDAPAHDTTPDVRPEAPRDGALASRPRLARLGIGALLVAIVLGVGLTLGVRACRPNASPAPSPLPPTPSMAPTPSSMPAP